MNCDTDSCDERSVVSEDSISDDCCESTYLDDTHDGDSNVYGEDDSGDSDDDVNGRDESGGSDDE